MDRILTFEKTVLHSFIIDKVLDCLPHLWLRKHRVFLVDRYIHQPTTQLIIDDHPVCFARAGDILGVQVPGDINITAFKHQPLGRAFLYMTHDNAFHRWCAAIIIRVTDQCDTFVRLPALERVRARSGRVCGKPGIAQIAIFFIGHHDFFVDNSTDRGGETV